MAAVTDTGPGTTAPEARREVEIEETVPREASVVEVLMFVWSYWRQVPYRFAGMVVGVFIAVALEVQIPRLSAELISVCERMLRGLAEAEAAWQAAGWLLGLFATTFFVRQLYFRNWCHVASQVMMRLLSDGFQRVQRFSLEWHSNHFAGSTQRKITRGMWAYDSLADTLIVDLGPALLLMLGFTVTMSLRDPALGIYFGTAVGIFVFVSIWISLRYVGPANVLSNQADSAVGGGLADAITCNSVVKAFGAERSENDRFGQLGETWRFESRRAWLRSMDAGAVQSLMLLLLLGGLLSLVLLRSATGGSRVEDAAYVIATYLVVHSYLRNIGWQVRNAQRAINELEDLVIISRTPPQVKDVRNAPRFVPGAGLMRFEAVDFSYRNQPERLFNDLTVEISPGEKLALVGESGSGKSTFAKLLQRLYDLDGGRITIDGQDIVGVTQESLRKAISIVPQEPILFHRSLAENISYAKPDASRSEVIEAARRAHAHEFIVGLSKGYDTLVGERGINLSGGERQRVAIARAILADAPILVLDEATSSLDSATEKLIQDALATLMKGRTAIIIAHRLSTIRQVDRILVFSGGRIVEEGAHGDLMEIDGGHYRNLVETQSFGVDESEL